MSHETVLFGHLPLFATVSRIIFLRNKTNHTLSWKLPPYSGHQVSWSNRIVLPVCRGQLACLHYGVGTNVQPIIWIFTTNGHYDV